MLAARGEALPRSGNGGALSPSLAIANRSASARVGAQSAANCPSAPRATAAQPFANRTMILQSHTAQSRIAAASAATYDG